MNRSRVGKLGRGRAWGVTCRKRRGSSAGVGVDGKENRMHGLKRAYR